MPNIQHWQRTQNLCRNFIFHLKKIIHRINCYKVKDKFQKSLDNSPESISLKYTSPVETLHLIKFRTQSSSD